MSVWNFKAETGYEGTVKAMDAQDAAELAWDFMCSRDPDNYQGGEVRVWQEGVPSQKFYVEVESVPSFHASPVKDKADSTE